MLTQERLKELLEYNPDTGIFAWRVRASLHLRIGDIAGTLHNDGGLYIGINGKRYYAHRLIWLYVYGRWPENLIDHINHKRTDNRIVNLREATQAENQHNKIRANKDSHTGFLGVSKRGKGFNAQIRLNGILKYLGRFKTPELAHAAYLDAKRKFHPFGTL